MRRPGRAARGAEDRVFFGLVIIVSFAFALVVRPFFAPILWALVAAIMFTSVNRWLLAKMPGRRNASAFLTLLLIVAVIIAPAIFITIALIQELVAFHSKFQSGEFDLARMFNQFEANLPDWASGFLTRMGLSDLNAVQDMLSASFTSSFRTLAAQALVIGQSAAGFLLALGVMLYLSYFLLRDGEALVQRVSEAAPLRSEPRRALMQQFVIVIRATIKGTIVIAILQGMLGGLVFWMLGISGALLWAVVLSFLSLVPVIGTGLLWVPVAIYLLATGAVVKALILIFCFLFVIGTMDNVLRPILVGRETRMPDYMVLISTLGGIELFGFSGLVVGPVIAALFISVWEIVTTMRLPAREETAEKTG